MDNMPPLPWLLQRADAHYIGEELAAAVHAYARAYAEQRCAPLIALLDAVRLTVGQDSINANLRRNIQAALEAQEKHHG